MKKTNKKGFTLVELLAVIVILGVLLLIAVPATNNIITENKKKAFVRNIQLVENKLKVYKTLYYSNNDDTKLTKNCIFFFGDTYNAGSKTKIDLDKGDLDGIVGYFYISSNWDIYFIHARDLNNNFRLGQSPTLKKANLKTEDGKTMLNIDLAPVEEDGDGIDGFLGGSSYHTSISEMSPVIHNSKLFDIEPDKFLTDSSKFNEVKCNFEN